MNLKLPFMVHVVLEDMTMIVREVRRKHHHGNRRHPQYQDGDPGDGAVTTRTTSSIHKKGLESRNQHSHSPRRNTLFHGPHTKFRKKKGTVPIINHTRDESYQSVSSFPVNRTVRHQFCLDSCVFLVKVYLPKIHLTLNPKP